MVYHRYQEAVLSRYESACRDLGPVDEQKDWLLDLLMQEKDDDLQLSNYLIHPRIDSALTLNQLLELFSKRRYSE